MPFRREKYPSNWDEFSRKIRFDRAGNICEKCGVPNYAIGCRIEGKFELFDDLDEMNLHEAATIRGENGYADSKALLEIILEMYADDFDEDFPRPTVIMLTVAHLDQIGDICECEKLTGAKCAIDSHVLALCQRCHLTYDIERHKFNRRRSRAEKMGQLWLADWDARFEL